MIPPSQFLILAVLTGARSELQIRALKKINRPTVLGKFMDKKENSLQFIISSVFGKEKRGYFN